MFDERAYCLSRQMLVFGVKVFLNVYNLKICKHSP